MTQNVILGPRSCFDFAQHERSFRAKSAQHLILSEVEGLSEVAGRGVAQELTDQGGK